MQDRFVLDYVKQLYETMKELKRGFAKFRYVMVNM